MIQPGVTTECRYYNGIIAKPFLVECTFDVPKSGLLLSIEGEETLYLPFSDIVVRHREKSLLIICSRSNTGRVIEFNDALFIASFFQHNKALPREHLYDRFIHAGTAIHLLFAATILVFCAALYFYAIPFLAEKAVDLIPRSVDDQLGQTVSNSPDFGTEEDTALSVALNQFLHTLAPELNPRYHITGMKDDIVNAYALPDGSIIIHTGILKKMNRFEELAGVLSHEIAHVEHRHGMRLLSRNLSGYLLLTLVLNDVNGLITVFVDNAHQFQTLSYSRKFEKEADLSGLELLRKHHINPQGMIDLFKMLEKEQDIDIPEWMSSHPVSKERILYLQEQINQHPVNIKEHPQLESSFNTIKNKIKN